mgnify:CR=1 FL=1
MAYEGVGIPKIYEAQMPQQSSGGDIVSRLLPSLASAYISGMRQKEASQLSADVKMYSTLASSAANYKTVGEVKGVLDNLIAEREVVAQGGDNVRASYLDASIAAVKPFYKTRQKQQEARTLINESEKQFEALENTPGYQEGALKLYEEWDSQLQEYDPYFTTRMQKDLKGQYDEMNLRLKALSSLDALDDDGVDDEGNIVKLEGIQINAERYPNEESLFNAKAAKDLLMMGLSTPQADKQLISKGLTHQSKMYNNLGVANAEQAKIKRQNQKNSVVQIKQNLENIDAKFITGKTEELTDIYPKAITDIGLTTNMSGLLARSESLSPERTTQLRNYVLHDLGRILQKTDGIPTELKTDLNNWENSAYSKNIVLLDDIYDKINYWKGNSLISRNDFLGNSNKSRSLNYPGTFGKDDNTRDLVITYLDFLENLQMQQELLAIDSTQPNNTQSNNKNNNQISNYGSYVP